LGSEHLTIREKYLRRIIDGQDSQTEVAKSRRPLDLEKSCAGFNPGGAEKIPEVRSSGYQSFRGRGTLVERNRDPRFPEWISTDNIGETCVEGAGESGSSAHRRIGASGAKSLALEVAISDFPRRSKPLISAGICGTRSWRIGVQHFGVLTYKRVAIFEIVISRYPITREGVVTWKASSNVHQGSTFRGFRCCKNHCRRNCETPKCDNHTAMVLSGGQVASAYRELGGSRVWSAKICVKVYEAARGDISVTIG